MISLEDLDWWKAVNYSVINRQAPEFSVFDRAAAVGLSRPRPFRPISDFRTHRKAGWRKCGSVETGIHDWHSVTSSASAAGPQQP
jgi:hypothetical protein